MNNKAIHTQRHERLADELRSVIKAAKPGERMDSMEVIAARYDVSINTARMALVLLQHEGWVRLRHGSGCYVSRPEAPVKGQSIAIISEYNLLLSPHSSVFAHIMNELRIFLGTGRSAACDLHLLGFYGRSGLGSHQWRCCPGDSPHLFMDRGSANERDPHCGDRSME